MITMLKATEHFINTINITDVIYKVTEIQMKRRYNNSNQTTNEILLDLYRLIIPSHILWCVVIKISSTLEIKSNSAIVQVSHQFKRVSIDPQQHHLTRSDNNHLPVRYRVTMSGDKAYRLRS